VREGVAAREAVALRASSVSRRREGVLLKSRQEEDARLTPSQVGVFRFPIKAHREPAPGTGEPAVSSVRTQTPHATAGHPPSPHAT
jgi:hypothetical protein